MDTFLTKNEVRIQRLGSDSFASETSFELLMVQTFCFLQIKMYLINTPKVILNYLSFDETNKENFRIIW